MKNIGWAMIEPDKLIGTIWQSLKPQEVEFDSKMISKLFNRKETAKNAQSERAQVKSFLKPDRSKNIEIILKKMKLEKNFKILTEVFLTYDPNIINEQLLIGLQNVMPTQKERSDFKDVVLQQGKNWTLADRFVKFAIEIPLM